MSNEESRDATDGVEEVREGPLCILEALDDHTFELNAKALESILLRPSISDKKVVVVSVAGAFRKGKSFLLDFFLRYLEKDGEDDWMGEQDEDLKGFPWRGGADRETTGIMMWSKPFVVTLPSNEQVVVLLMDTQGAFDSSSTVKDCATVFAISTLISSVQVYNISANLQEDNLQHLQLFTDYGCLAMDGMEGEKPFQRLEFLIRDWSYPYEFGYGDGQAFLDKRLQLDQSSHEELRRTRQQIYNCFEKLGCFLMPHPGKHVATNPNFKGRLRDIDGEFKEYLDQLVPRLLAPSNLLVKSINGSDLTCRELLEYFIAYMKMFAAGELPEPKTMLQATAEANNRAAVAKSLEEYRRDMEELCGGDAPYLNPRELENRSEIYRNKALTLFNATRKMGGPEISREFEELLNKDIDEAYVNFIKINDSKNIFNAARTPAVFLVIIVISYMVSGFCLMIGLGSLASLFNLVLGLALLAVVTWAYVRFSGELREIGSQLDTVAEWIWDEVFMAAYSAMLEKGAQSMVERQKTGRKKKD
eukprot:TCONS_00034289-protein